jgi:hypothetical protein
LILTHRAFAPALIFALASGDMVNFLGAGNDEAGLAGALAGAEDAVFVLATVLSAARPLVHFSRALEM